MNCLNLFLYKKSQYYKLASNTELRKVNILPRKLQYLMRSKKGYCWGGNVNHKSLLWHESQHRICGLHYPPQWSLLVSWLFQRSLFSFNFYCIPPWLVITHGAHRIVGRGLGNPSEKFKHLNLQQLGRAVQYQM